MGAESGKNRNLQPQYFLEELIFVVLKDPLTHDCVTEKKNINTSSSCDTFKIVNKCNSQLIASQILEINYFKYMEFLTGKGSNPKTTLYVGGLEDSVTPATLHAAFLPFGDITDVSIPLDHATGKHRGFGFVQYETAEDAEDAIDNMNNAGKVE